MHLPSVQFLGLPLHSLTLAEAAEACRGLALSGRAGQWVVTAGALTYAEAFRDETFRRMWERAALVLPDGMGVVWGARWNGVPVREKVSGVDLVPVLLGRLAGTGARVFLFGGRPGVAAEAMVRLAAAHPGVVFAGSCDGYSPEARALEAIRAARPQVLLAGLGQPAQERWLERHLEALGIPLGIGVGGSLDVYAGRLRLAPEWVRRGGLEWAYRALREPRRLARWSGLLRFGGAVMGWGRPGPGRKGPKAPS